MKPILAFLILGIPALSQDGVQVYVNGRLIPERSVIVDNKSYLPSRAVAEYLNATVDYDAQSKRVDITTGGVTKESDIQRALVQNGLLFDAYLDSAERAELSNQIFVATTEDTGTNERLRRALFGWLAEPLSMGRTHRLLVSLSDAKGKQGTSQPGIASWEMELNEHLSALFMFYEGPVIP